MTWHGKGDYLAVVMPQADSMSVLIHQLSRQRTQVMLQTATRCHCQLVDVSLIISKHLFLNKCTFSASSQVLVCIYLVWSSSLCSLYSQCPVVKMFPVLCYPLPCAYDTSCLSSSRSVSFLICSGAIFINVNCTYRMIRFFPKV